MLHLSTRSYRNGSSYTRTLDLPKTDSTKTRNYSTISGVRSEQISRKRKKTDSTKTRNYSTTSGGRSTASEEVISSFNSAEESFKTKSSLNLLRALFVFAICSQRWLVMRSETLLKTSTKILGKTVTNYFLKITFFGHFCAGENENSIIPTVEHLRKNGVGGILDYAAEADITEKNITTPDNIQCRIYDYEGELQCDANVDIFLSCVLSVRNVTPEGFAAIKVTALGQPRILERMSAAILETRKLFSKFDHDNNGKVTLDEFRFAFNELFVETSLEEIDQIFMKFDADKTGFIDYIEWTSTMRLEDIFQLTSKSRIQNSLTSSILDKEETKLMHNMMSRLTKIAEHAAKCEVRLMIDAEHTYFQPAIDHLVIDLQRRFNKGFPTIFNTYQCYLKDCYSRVAADIDRAEREGYFFAAKIVRGAYLVLERNRAKEMQYPDPIFDTLEETHENYHKVLDLVLSNIKNANVMVASHNQNSIEYAVKKMEALGINPTNGGVYFGQLLGMADNLTLNLGRYGYKAYKYVPYGPIQEVVPYLIRRAQENSNILGNSKKERFMLRSEIFRRSFRRTKKV